MEYVHINGLLAEIKLATSLSEVRILTTMPRTLNLAPKIYFETIENKILIFILLDFTMNPGVTLAIMIFAVVLL